MRVGTSRLIDLEKIADEDHPHACGDKGKTCLVINILNVSSPCVWGQGTGHGKISARYGIIPMRVGTRIKK